MGFFKLVVRIVLLLFVGVSIGAIWLYCDGFLPTDLAQRGVSIASAQRAAGILTVLALVLASAIPLQSLFPKKTLAAAVAVGWIPLALGLSLALPLSESVSEGSRIFMLSVEGCIDWLAIVVGAWAVARVRRRA